MKNIARRLGVTLAITGLSLATFAPAYATNKVSSPDVTKGKVEFEYRGGYDIDAARSKNAIDQHKFVANYGITDYWRMEMKAVLATNSSHVRDWTFIEWSNRLQLNKDGSVWPKLAVQANYKFSLQDARADKLEGTFLLGKDTGPLVHVMNLNFENEVGAHSGSGTNVNVGWKTKYRYQDYLDPGVELFADFGKVIGPVAAGAKKYQMGPVFSGAVTKNVKYEFGVLFGMSPAAPDARLKGMLTYGF